MQPLTRLKFLILTLLFSFASLPVLALQVKSIQSTGTLKMDDGQEFHLAGLIIPSESLSLLSVILAGKDLNIEQESSKDYQKGDFSKAGYLYVKAFEMDFPFKPQTPPRESTLMVNQLLLSLGLARVDTERVFKHRDQFLKIEAEARSQGKGIWSYETLPPHS